MKERLIYIILAFGLNFLVNGCSFHKAYDWQSAEMDSQSGKFVTADLNPTSPFCEYRSRCTFELHYFFGSNYDPSNSERKNILFISGGPGIIVDRQLRDLKFLESQYNIVYFDVRGTGFSLIPGSNTYDQLLRAKFVVEDIEAIRKNIFNECSKGPTPRGDDSPGTLLNGCKSKGKAWDAIYAHSWGTIVAQRYAAKYRDNVQKLILSAPVSRGQADTEAARRRMIVSNLEDIFERQRTVLCPWFMNRPVYGDFPGVGIPKDTDNFCFLTKQDIGAIKRGLLALLNDLGRDYGSIGFARSFYDKLWKDDGAFRQKYPYPKQFFTAIRQLEELGAGERYPLKFESTVMELKTSAALLIGYYTSLNKEILRNELNPDNENATFNYCQLNEAFLASIPAEGGNKSWRNSFCQRLRHAYLRQLNPQESSPESLRARSVFGVYDGLTRWIFELFARNDRLHKGCFSGKDLQDVAAQEGITTSIVMQKEAEKLGTKTNEQICPWDPGLVKHDKPVYRHDVETLILKGSADSITAGGQAEYFYESGLTKGRRVLLEFPAAGHLPIYQVDPRFGNTVSQTNDLVTDFLDLDIQEFTDEVREQISDGKLSAKLVSDF